MSTQLGWGGSSEHAMGAQQHKQTSTSGLVRSRVSGESFPLAGSQLLLYLRSFHVFSKFDKYTHAKTKSASAVALWEQRKRQEW